MDKKVIKYRLDFEFLKDDPDILAILLFGSQTSSEATSRSDIDICIVAPNISDINDRVLFFKRIYTNLDVFRKRYDIWLFEELALYLKMRIINNHKIIYCKDEPELFEYFYFYRKLWNDQKRRQELSKDELIKLLDK